MQTRAERPPSECCSYPCPWLPWVEEETDRQTHTHTHMSTHTRSLSQAASSISPPSALLNPIVQKGAGRPGAGPLPPSPPLIHHWAHPPQEVGRLGQLLRPSCPFLSPPVYGLLQAQLVALVGGKGTGEKQSKGSLLPSARVGKTLQVQQGHLFSHNRFLHRGGRPRACPPLLPLKC